MGALGLIETRGFTGAIIAADTALKAANVSLIKAEIIKGGLVTIQLTGDVGAIKAAVEAGSAAVKPSGVFIASHVIPRMHPETYQLVEKTPEIEEEQEEPEPEEELQAVSITAEKEELKDTNKLEETPVNKQQPITEELLVYENLAKLTVSELRKLVRERKVMQDDVKAIKYARKEDLIKRLI